MEDAQEFKKLFDQEVKKIAVHRVIQNRNNSIFGYLKHPLISVVVGFLLTGVAGTWLTNHFQAKQENNQLQREAHESIRQFSQAIAFRATEASYLRSALLRKVPPETVIERKKSYDEASKQWNKEIWRHLYIFREYSGSPSRVFIEENITNDLIPIFRVIDGCLTEVFDKHQEENLRNSGEFFSLDEISCWIASAEKEYTVDLVSLIRASRECGYEISNLLFHYVAVNLKSEDNAWPQTRDHAVPRQISENCQRKLDFAQPDHSRPVDRKAVDFTRWVDKPQITALVEQ